MREGLSGNQSTENAVKSKACPWCVDAHADIRLPQRLRLGASRDDTRHIPTFFSASLPYTDRAR